MAKDPVCGMEIDEKTAAGRGEYQGMIYYFCAPGCMQAFDEQPEKFVNQKGPPAKEDLHRDGAHN
jgi:Cu+-exporting ATPase